jgi:hypothetical protein
MRACIIEGGKCTAELDRVVPVGQYSFLSAVLTGSEGTREASAFDLLFVPSLGHPPGGARGCV